MPAPIVNLDFVLNAIEKVIRRASYWNGEVVPRLAEATADQWLRRDEIRRRLKLTTCELAHLRDAGN